MKVVAIKDMAAGNDTIGEMWKETKVFDASDSLSDVMEWAKNRKTHVILTVPENDAEEFEELTNNKIF